MAERVNATETYVQTQLGLYVPKSLYDANTILKADTDDTPVALSVPASTFVGRKAAGSISAMSATEAAALLTSLVPKSLYDANTVLAADTDDTPAAVVMGASTILARLAAGNIKAATVAEIVTLLGPLLPGKQLDYAAITSDATTTATTEATATALITGNSVTYDGSQVRIFVTSRGIQNSLGLGGAASTIVVILRDSTVIGGLAAVAQGSSVQNIPLAVTMVDTPSAGAHTYSAKMYVNSASTGTVKAGAGGTGANIPAELRVAKV